MIAALLVGAVHAAGPQVDLLADYPALHTTAVAAYAVPPLGGVAVEQRLDPQRMRLDGGLLAEVLFGPHDANQRVLLSLGLRGHLPVYELQGYTFDPSVWDTRVGLAIHDWFAWRRVPFVDGYLVAGGGLQASTMAQAPWPTTIAPAAHGFFGLGLGTRTGPWSVRVEGRVATAVRVDRFDGRAQLAEEAIRWTFWPGSASASVLVGLGWRFGADPL